jgi:hypothetical protein
MATNERKGPKKTQCLTGRATTGHQKPPKATKGHQKPKFAESAAREESFYRSLPIFTATGFSGTAGFDL